MSVCVPGFFLFAQAVDVATEDSDHAPKADGTANPSTTTWFNHGSDQNKDLGRWQTKDSVWLLAVCAHVTAGLGYTTVLQYPVHLRCGGRDLKSSGAYPVPFGRRVADLHMTWMVSLLHLYQGSGCLKQISKPAIPQATRTADDCPDMPDLMDILGNPWKDRLCSAVFFQSAESSSAAVSSRKGSMIMVHFRLGGFRDKLGLSVDSIYPFSWHGHSWTLFSCICSLQNPATSWP